VSIAASRCAELLYFQCIELSGSIWQVCNRTCCVCPDSGLAVRTDEPAARVVWFASFGRSRLLWCPSFTKSVRKDGHRDVISPGC
jgi:hypothetical protein